MKPRHVKGSAASAGKARIGVVVAEFNEYFTAKLLDGALDTLKRHGVRPSNVDAFHVPGSFEIPVIVKRALKKRRSDAFITLGVILKGENRHWKEISDAAARGTLSASLGTGVPVIHGVITAETREQAVDRIGGKMGHKGRQAAQSALEMADLVRRL